MSQPTSPHRLPNLNAPRYRLPVSGTLNKQVFNQIRGSVAEAEQLSDARLKALLLSVNELIAQTMISHHAGVLLPEQLGHLFIGSCPARKADSIDYKASAELGQRVRHRNWDTDGFLAKIFYSNTDSHFKHRELWAFRASKRVRQQVSQHYPANWRNYLRVEPDRKLKHIFQQQLQQLELGQQPSMLLGYDELAF